MISLSRPLIFALVFVCACEESYNRELKIQFTHEYDRVCIPFYKQAITHAESLMVDLHRPVENRWGFTCLQEKQWLQEHGPEKQH